MKPHADGPSDAALKWCGRCDLDKPLDQFGPNVSRNDGLAPYCRECFQQISRDGYRRARARVGETVRSRPVTDPGHRWCPDCADQRPESDFPRNSGTASGLGVYCKPHHNLRGRESKERRGGSRDYHLLRRYGIGAGDVADMVARQGGVCPICVRPLGARHHVDHDHATGEVRGVLCFTCNGGLGNYGDDAARLRRAADYLDHTLTAPSLVAPGVYDVAGLAWRRPDPRISEDAARPSPDRVGG